MINEWNKLASDCVNATSVNVLTKKIGKYIVMADYELWMHGMPNGTKYYVSNNSHFTQTREQVLCSHSQIMITKLVS